MARDNDTRLRSITLIAAPTDFSEAGELALFINESQIAYPSTILSGGGLLRYEG
jgi:polyhydroxyalkanoate synthase